MQLCQSFQIVPLLQGAMLSLYLGTRKPFQNALSNDASQGMVAQTLSLFYQYAGLQQVISSIAEGPQCMMILGKEGRTMCKVKSPIIIVAVCQVFTGTHNCKSIHTHLDLMCNPGIHSVKIQSRLSNLVKGACRQARQALSGTKATVVQESATEL